MMIARWMETALQDNHEALQDGEKLAVPIYDRVILAFLARRTDERSGDAELLSQLEDPESKQVGEAILNPAVAPANIDVAQKALRFFLDARNTVDAETLRTQINEMESGNLTVSGVNHVHGV